MHGGRVAFPKNILFAHLGLQRQAAVAHCNRGPRRLSADGLLPGHRVNEGAMWRNRHILNDLQSPASQGQIPTAQKLAAPGSFFKSRVRRRWGTCRVSRRIWETGRLGLSHPGRPARAVGFTGRPREVWRSMFLERQSVNAAAGKGDFVMCSCDTSPVGESGLHARVPNLYPECHLSTCSRGGDAAASVGDKQALTQLSQQTQKQPRNDFAFVNNILICMINMS